MTAPLPLPDDPRIPALIEAWPQYRDANEPERYLHSFYPRSRYPRSRWLHDFEAILCEHYPASSSKQPAPFLLAKPGVP